MLRTIKNYLHLFNALTAALFYRFPGKHIKVIGVTGTDGKTTTTHMIYEVLKKAGKKTSMVSSVYGLIGGVAHDTGFHVTTPDPWFLQKSLRASADNGDEYFVLETTSHGLDQNRVFGISFEVGVLTNITHEHLDYHRTYEAYVKAKYRLLRSAKIAIVNKEDASYKHLAMFRNIDKLNNEWVSYGLKDGDNTLKNFSFSLNIPGEYNKLNALAAASATQALGIEKDKILQALNNFKGIVGRFETIKTKLGFDVIIDFAHTPNSLVRVLSTVRGMTKGRIIHVFGCAGLRDFTKRPMMGGASAKYADITVVTEEDTRTEDIDKIMSQIEEGYQKEFKIQSSKFKVQRQLFKIPNRQEAIDKAISLAKKGDVVILTGKGHEKSLCRGTIEYPWSDQEGVARALKKLSK